MAQISLYIDDVMIEKLHANAKASNLSISKYAAAIISERMDEDDTDEMRKRHALNELKGVLAP